MAGLPDVTEYELIPFGERVARLVPAVDRLAEQRDSLRRELNDAVEQADHLRRQLERAGARLEELTRQRGELLARVEQLESEGRDASDSRAELERRERELVEALWVPPGHFYSPIPDLDEVRARRDELFNRAHADLPGVDLNPATQVELLDAFEAYADEIDYPREPDGKHRYHWDNGFFSLSDAWWLHCMVRHFRPRRLIEVGSGFSTCVVLDVEERHGTGELDLTMIEPYPDRLLGLVHEGDLDRARLLQTTCQEVPLAVFEELRANDVLFVDSSHVAKIGSDVSYLLFEVLPRLAPGVIVHFHDVLYPFEYGMEEVLEGRAWNEAYVLRAFLQFNREFEILFWPSAIACVGEHVDRALPQACFENLGPSLWLRRT